MPWEHGKAEERNFMREETPISAEKIWIHIKKYWWVCVLTAAVAVAAVVLDTWREYRANAAAALRDTYQADSMIYYPIETEPEATTLLTLLDSQQMIGRVNEALAAEGLEEFDGGTDKLSMAWKGSCFPITVISEGEERTRLISTTLTEALLEWAEEHMGSEGQIVNHTQVYPCLVQASGAVTVYPPGASRAVGLTFGSFLGWKKLMVMCAGFLCGAAFLFVLLIFDTKLRTRQEAAQVCEYPCLGEVKRRVKDPGKEWAAINAVIGCHLPSSGGILYVTFSNEKAVNQAAAGVLPENRERVRACVWSRDRLEVLCKETPAAGAVLLICLNQDRVNQVETLAEDMENRKIPILGYVVTEG